MLVSNIQTLQQKQAKTKEIRYHYFQVIRNIENVLQDGKNGERIIS